MNKVKIKCSVEIKPDRQKVLEVLSAHDVKCFKLHEMRGDGFLVWCNSDADTDKLFSVTCMEALKRLYCEPLLPPEVKARRTVILRHVDESILDRSSNDIIVEVQQRNKWLSLVDLYIFPNSPTIKLVCSTNEMAIKALNSGVLIFNLSIPAANIVQEEFVSLISCYRCYAIEDHQASSCTKPKEFKACSVCAMSGHTYRECTSNNRKCLNCGGGHSSLAMSCPERKRKVLEKKKLMKLNKSYATAAKPNSILFPSADQAQIKDNELLIKAYMCITLSTMKNHEDPGTFQHTLTHLLQANGLPNIVLGDISPPTMRCLIPVEESKNVNFDDSKVLSGNDTEITIPDNKKSLTSTAATEATIYKKKNTPLITPNNVHGLYAAGSILLDCQGSKEQECLLSLSSASKDQFDNNVTIIELKNKEFDQKAGLFRTRKSLRNFSSSQPVQ